MRRSSPVLVALALVVGLTACGSSSKSSSATTTAAAGATTTAAAVAPDTAGMAEKAGLTGTVNFDSDETNIVATPTSGSVDIELADYYIGPTYINVKPGTTLHATLKNAGAKSHTFTIDSLQIDQVLSPGGTASVDIQVPATGALQFYCRYHRSMGMQGAIFATP